MCGIAGTSISRSGVLEAMLARIAHRGPDSRGLWVDEGGEMALAHARLAVIDLSAAGAQPMVSPCGNYVLAFNGEIYNHAELRAELEALGETFRGHSDTEVLLVLLRRDGLEALERLVGMFAFALWDRTRHELTLVRDRLGIKPLVWAPLGDDIAFGSEIHGLRAHPGIDLDVDRRALSEYFACLYVPAPRTIHAGIRKLAPGHWLRWKKGRPVEQGRWWRPHYAASRSPSLDEAVEEVLPLLRQAVHGCMVSDVPVGCFLSGGIDSSVIAALMAQEARRSGGPPIRTFTMTFDTATYDEREAAKQVAAHIGSDHRELQASPLIVGRLDESIRLFGEPFGNPTSLLIDDLSRMAREHVTVALVGDGGDEVFAGYPRHQGGLLAARYRRALPEFLRKAVIGPLAQLIPERSDGRHTLRRIREFLTSANLADAETYASWVEYFSPEERAMLLGDHDRPLRPVAEIYRAAPSDNPLDAMQQTDLEAFLPGNLLAYGDAMSMAHGLELRLPLLDHRVIETVGAIDPRLRFLDGKKTLLKAVARRLLPSAIVDRPKLGFNPPLGLWLKGALAPMVAERLTKQRMDSLGIAWPVIDRLLGEQRRNHRDHSLKIWSLLVLEAWDRSLRP